MILGLHCIKNFNTNIVNQNPVSGPNMSFFVRCEICYRIRKQIYSRREMRGEN